MFAAVPFSFSPAMLLFDMKREFLDMLSFDNKASSAFASLAFNEGNIVVDVEVVVDVEEVEVVEEVVETEDVDVELDVVADVVADVVVFEDAGAKFITVVLPATRYPDCGNAI